MGKPGAAEGHRYACHNRDGVTVWQSPAVSPALMMGALVIDLSRFLWIRRLVLKSAR
jgi:hypothetical protein